MFFGLYKDDLSSEANKISQYGEAEVEQYDLYANVKVFIDHNDTQLCGVVKGQKREWDGTLQIKANINPILDTRVYDVSFPDGNEKEYAFNVVYESMWEQYDCEVNEEILLDLIIDHKETSDSMEE